MLLLFFVAIPALGFFGNKVMLDSYGAGKLDIVIQESLNDWTASKPADFDTAKGLSYQASSAPTAVTLVEFVDLFCPHCKAATPSLHAFAESRPDTKLILKIFPLDGTCNQVISRKGDGMRCQWSYALFCAEKLAQKGWPGLDWIFERQAVLNFAQYDEQLQEFSSSLQLKLEDLKTCMGQSDTMDLITSMANEGQKAEIQGTPAVFLNGRKVDRGQALPVLDAIYRKAKNP
jgi:protein-disulfide isomerase